MIQLVDEKLEQYAREHTSPTPDLLAELAAYTHANTELPQMQVGQLEGMFLKVLVRITRAKRVVEVGTFTGYSGLMMASGLPDDGELITCELDPKNAEIARRFFDKSPHGDKIRIELGPAAESLAKLSGPVDMAFIDADKQNYVRYFDLLLPKMRAGGLIVADNVLWSGQVLDEPSEQSESTRGIVAFNEHVRKHESLDRVMVTVRDGMTLIAV